MREEERRREQADDGQCGVVGVREGVGDRADVGDVPRDARAEDERGDGAASRSG
jgi:hypothetical protein